MNLGAITCINMQVQADPWEVITRCDSTQFDRWNKGQTWKDITLENGVPLYQSNFKLKSSTQKYESHGKTAEKQSKTNFASSYSNFQNPVTDENGLQCWRETDLILCHCEYGTNVLQSTPCITEEDSLKTYVCLMVKHSPKFRPQLTKTIRNSTGW